jgi:hypothetical protein
MCRCGLKGFQSDSIFDEHKVNANENLIDGDDGKMPCPNFLLFIHCTIAEYNKILIFAKEDNGDHYINITPPLGQYLAFITTRQYLTPIIYCLLTDW